MVVGVQEQVAISRLFREELIGESSAIPVGIWVEVIFSRVGVTGAMLGIHEHGELGLLGPRGIENNVLMLEVRRVILVSVVLDPAVSGTASIVYTI